MDRKHLENERTRQLTRLHEESELARIEETALTRKQSDLKAQEYARAAETAARVAAERAIAREVELREEQQFDFARRIEAMERAFDQKLERTISDLQRKSAPGRAIVPYTPTGVKGRAVAKSVIGQKTRTPAGQRIRSTATMRHKATQPQAATKVPPPAQPTIEPVMQGMTRAAWISTVKLTKTHNTRLDFHNLEAKDDSKDMRDWVKEIEDVAQVNAKGTEHGTRAEHRGEFHHPPQTPRKGKLQDSAP